MRKVRHEYLSYLLLGFTYFFYYIFRQIAGTQRAFINLGRLRFQIFLC